MVLYERSGEDIDRGLVGYWKLDDLKLSGATKAIDRAKFNDGTITGATNTEGINGLNKDAMYFDGVDDYVSLGSNDNLNLTDKDFSISFWANPKGSGERAVLVDDSTPNQFGIRGAGYWSFYNGGWEITTAIAINDEWQFVTYIYNSTTKVMSLYLNNILNKSFVAEPQGTFIPNIISSSSHSFNGSIQNVRIYNRVLTSGEISKLYRLKK